MPGRAFTLIELVIVVALMGVIAAVAVPRFSAQSDERRIDLAQARLDQALGSWIELAKLREESYVVYFDQTNDVCWLFVEGQEDPDQAVESIDVSGSPYNVTLSTRSSLDHETTLTIDRNGVVSGDLQIALVVGSTKRPVSYP